MSSIYSNTSLGDLCVDIEVLLDLRAQISPCFIRGFVGFTTVLWSSSCHRAWALRFRGATGDSAYGEFGSGGLMSLMFRTQFCFIIRFRSEKAIGGWILRILSCFQLEYLGLKRLIFTFASTEAAYLVEIRDLFLNNLVTLPHIRHRFKAPFLDNLVVFSAVPN
ncbi:hypothetical protein FRX31_030135 [Thalictrum thalictroides]|uniref:Uncharacterized protein n=1 Tax=Thalictrum thalictroides TaxID=46969 RepID=A0A7J6V7W0_THATH|nr:hypothetical protein FRX31_030135 [Thalictrum thalictroides]